MASEPVRVTPEISVARRELALSYVRAGGPGGQNVNKVASKAVLRFNVRDSPSLPEPARQRALTRLASRLTGDGELIVTSSVFRDQARNREAAIDRFRELLADAVRVRRARKRTRPSRSAVERRLVDKRRRGERKKLRVVTD